MKHRLITIRLFTLAAMLSLSASARAYMVAPSPSLEKMTEMADLVVKAKVIDAEPVDDPWFKPTAGYGAYATELQIISVFKGEPGGKKITFRHYKETDPRAMRMFMPQHYKLNVGRSYIVFASKTEKPGVFRQLWANHTMKEDHGVLRAADEKPRTEKSMAAVYWTELTGLLASEYPDDVIYGVGQLDQFSRRGWDGLEVFGRQEVAEAVRPLLGSKDQKILTAAIGLAAWAQNLPSGVDGLGDGNVRYDNEAGKVLWRELMKVADGAGPATLRARAIGALRHTGVEALPAALDRWAADRQPAVRQAALILFADFSGETATRHIAAATRDESSEVRQGAAQAIGLARIVPLVPLLGTLLKDPEPRVRDAAAMSLLACPLEASGELLRANVRDPEYRSVFVNALAAKDPGSYLDDLAEVVAKEMIPSRFWGGRTPSYEAWNILFKYVQSRPPAELQAGKFDAALNALEKGRSWSSSEPRDLYALYLQRGLTDRAKTFRADCRKRTSYDIDYYFKMVDENPGGYRRE
jgi:hypothetical protein